jgi:hypothetical protein
MMGAQDVPNRFEGRGFWRRCVRRQRAGESVGLRIERTNHLYNSIVVRQTLIDFVRSRQRKPHVLTDLFRPSRPYVDLPQRWHLIPPTMPSPSFFLVIR